MLLAVLVMLTLLPAAALAEEPDTSEIECVEEPANPAPADPDASEAIDASELGMTDPAIDALEPDPADAVIDASELEYYEIPLIDPRYPTARAVSRWEDDPNAVPLADSGAPRCIDRVRLPQFARDFYDTLARESKPADRSGLGRDGVLIDPSLCRDVQTFTDGDAYVIRTSFPTEVALRQDGYRFKDYKSFILNCMGAVLNAFDWDYPEVFWLGGHVYYYDLYNRTFGILLTYKDDAPNPPDWDIRAEGYRDPDVIKRDISALRQSVESIIREADRASSDYDKITYFNEWLTTNNQYNYTVAYTQNSVDRSVHTALGALTTKDGRPGGGRTGLDGPVCTGYAKAFLLLCQEADIPCGLVSGAYHIWNYVQPNPSDSRWFAVDVTWNDPIVDGDLTLAEYAALGANSNMESTAYTLVGADTIVYTGKVETFLDQHPEESVVADEYRVHANFSMVPELSRLAYVNSAAIRDLDAPVKGALPDTRVTLTSEPRSGHHPTASGTEELLINPVVTWSPAPVNGRFADNTTYTATITCTPLRQGYGLTPVDAPKITVPGADRVTVTAGGAIQAVFEAKGPKAEDFTCRLPARLTYDGSSKTAEVRSSVSSAIHSGYFTLVFTDGQGRPVTDLVKPGEYRVLARVSAHGGYPAGEVLLGTVSIQEGPGLHGSVTVSVGSASSPGSSGAAYAAKEELIVLHVSPDPGYRLNSLRVLRDDNGREVSLSGGGTQYTFKMPDGDVSVKAVFAVT